VSKKPVQRQSQIITTFGPGAMIDLPTRSVLIGGLDRWKIGSDATKGGRRAGHDPHPRGLA
jgi:hypothetical protein